MAQTKNELEGALVAAQAGHIYQRTGRESLAEGELRTARNVFMRLGAKYYLDQLNESTPDS